MENGKAKAFHRNHSDQSGTDFLREFIYGGVDGGVTTFAVVAGATGANFDSTIIIILGLANLVALCKVHCIASWSRWIKPVDVPHMLALWVSGPGLASAVHLFIELSTQARRGSAANSRKALSLYLS